MLHKFAITNIDQFDKLVKDARSIVIYGSRMVGKLAVDYLIETGNRDKIAAIVHTRGSKNYPQNYRQIPIQGASAFFALPEHKDAFVVVAVGKPKYKAEIFEALENYGVYTSAYLEDAAVALGLQLDLATGDAHHSNMLSFIFTEKQLCDLVDSANEAVIYSTGELGDRVVNYLKQVGRGSKIQENIRLIEESPDKYSTATVLAGPAAEDALVLVVPEKLADFEIEIKGLDPAHYYFCTGELMEKLFALLKNKSQEGRTAQEIQFLIAGFPKCGTTSVYYALQRVGDIYLPANKETTFFPERERDPVSVTKEKWFRRFYSYVPDGSVSGSVDPSFVTYAKEIRETLGSDLKICLLMRNPVEAYYSYFRMSKHCGFFYDSYGKYCEETFDDFIIDCPEEVKSSLDYANILEEFLQYYPMKQIKIVMLEELIREPGEKINEILRFVGSKEVYDPQLGLPKENAANFVWADDEGAMLACRSWFILNEKLIALRWHILDDPEAALTRANEMENHLLRLQKQMDAAEKIYNPKMTPEQRKHLEDYYRPGVRKLEKMLGKDLSKLWFE